VSNIEQNQKFIIAKELEFFQSFCFVFFWFLKTTMNYELRNFHLILFLLCLKVEKLTMIFRILSIKITSDESWLLISSKRKSYFLFFRRIISMESEFEIEQNLFFFIFKLLSLLRSIHFHWPRKISISISNRKTKDERDFVLCWMPWKWNF
jgi:hypothetical protein